MDALASPDLEDALVVALDHIGSPAFVTDSGGHPVYANAVGAKMFDRDPAGMTKSLQRKLTPPASDVRKIKARGPDPHWLVVLPPEVEVPDERLVRAAEHWRLTKRQSDVLELVVKGEANKTIAAKLGCAVATTEVHLAAILRKSGLDSRSQLAWRFWTL